MIIKGLFTSTIYRGDLDFQGHFDPWIFQFFNFKDSSVFFRISLFQFFQFFKPGIFQFSIIKISRLEWYILVSLY